MMSHKRKQALAYLRSQDCNCSAASVAKHINSSDISTRNILNCLVSEHRVQKISIIVKSRSRVYYKYFKKKELFVLIKPVFDGVKCGLEHNTF